MPQTKLSSIVNHRLFSIDYLLKRLPKREDWKGKAPERDLLNDVIEIYERAGPLVETGNEDTVREEIVNRMLAIINSHFLVNEVLPTGGRPDYVFFASSDAKQEKNLEKAIAVGDAKEPGTDFDRTPPRGRSPVRQVYDYMADTRPRWGILTDGRRWRLLNYDSPTDSFLEIDLHDISLRQDTDEWLYFYNLFRMEALVPRNGKCFLDSVKEENIRYAQEVGDELKERVYAALRELAQGFVVWPENGHNPAREEVREHIRESCFILLYRLLFIYYAEARGLLPKDRQAYNRISLETLRQRVKGASRDDSRFLADSRSIWSGLKDLFRLIDQGNAELEIPPYNGGLFSSSLQHADFFHRFDIADKYLARAISFLGTAPSLEDKSVYANVDYAGLDIRHLGSIYEGLLEYRLQYAEADMVSIRRKRGEVWVRATDYKGKTPLESLSPERKVSKGELYLETDRHERKVTGSYYTPDYIVKYIVRETLGPIVKDKHLQAERESQGKSDTILSIKVCDPAMGSGHFLVEATDFLAEALLRAVMEDQLDNLSPPTEVDLVWAKREVVRHCIYGVDSNPLAVELAKVSLWLATISRDKPLSFLNHHLKCGNSVVGSGIVDLGWLPGQRPEHVQGSITAPFGYIEKILTRLDELEGIADETVEDVKEKEALFRQIQESDEYRRIKALADVHDGISFTGPDFEKIHSGYMELANEAYHGDSEKWQRKFSVAWAQTAAEESRRRRVFHWEFEFPDVFFRRDDDASNPGFDAIVGNPPYVRIHGLADEETKSYLRSTYESAWMNFDLYVVFVERGLDLISARGRFGFILPTKFFYTEYGKPLRNELRNGGHIVQILDFGHNQIFPGETTYTCVLILAKTTQESFVYYHCRETPNPQENVAATLADPDAANLITKASYKHADLSSSAWALTSGKKRAILDRLKRTTRPLGDVVGRVFVGIQTSLDEVYVLDILRRLPDGYRVRLQASGDEFEIEKTFVLQLISGSDVDRYRVFRPTRVAVFPYITDGEKVRLATPQEIEASAPRTWAYLKRHESRLRAREGGKADSQKWYGYIYSKNLEMQRRPKIVLSKIVKELQASVDETGHYCLLADLANGIEFHDNPELGSADGWYLLTVLNSTLVNFLFKLRTSRYRGGYYSSTPKYLELIPILEIDGSENSEPSRVEGDLDAPINDCLKTGNLSSLNQVIVNRRPLVKHGMFFALRQLGKKMAMLRKEEENETNGFLDWLQDWTNSSIDSWKQKTKVRAYSRHPLPTLLRILNVNKDAIDVNPASRSFRDQLTVEYNRSVSTLSKLREEVGRIDLLIDLLVYQLYDMTPEEIGTVENASVAAVREKYQWASN